MHNEFKALLPDASGQSEIVIAANVDIRGFSRFSLEVESVEAAIYIRKVYERILSDFFPAADFFKPTGDGLLIVFSVDEDSLAALSNDVVSKSLELIKSFPTLLDGDALINFAVPSDIGIGLARGAACRLSAGEKTLDYSGKVLNLASRLMDLARPRGLVIDDTYGIGLINDDLAAQFTTEALYVRSVAEGTPRTVHFSSEDVEISPSSRRPINVLDWEKFQFTRSFRQIVRMDTTHFSTRLPKATIDSAQLTMRARFPDVVNGKKVPNQFVNRDVPVGYQLRAGEPWIVWNPNALAVGLKQDGVKQTWDVEFTVTFPV